jgi:hypothetical protein
MTRMDIRSLKIDVYTEEKAGKMPAPVEGMWE